MNDFKHLKPGASPYRYAMDPQLLDTFPNPHQDRPYEVRFMTEEVTSLCPVTGQPDFYRVTITYIPAQRCIESKSLKLYLFSLRNTGIFAEDMANRILEDLVRACSPIWIQVICKMRPRGGISLSVRAEEGQRPEGAP